MSLIALLIFMTAPRFDKRNLEFKSFVFHFKSDLRQLEIENMDKSDSYSLIVSKDKYTIYRKWKPVKRRKCKEGMFFTYGEDRLYTSKSRGGAFGKARSFYIVDKKLKRVERVTIMLGSGRIVSYHELYDKKYDKY